MSNAAVALENVTKSFGQVKALDGVSLDIRGGEFFSLLGPSGCGKTTVLRLVAGFEQPDAGEIKIQGLAITNVPPQRRPVNTVFQNYALFPHLSVFDNVAFGLRMRKTSHSELERRVAEAMALTHISELRTRMPDQISGGQKQRVAVARAIVNEPAVLLLDEPLAAIDAKLRAQLQTDLRAMQRQLKTTFIYVTHDQDEALALSDRIALMQDGRIVQIGTAREVYERPRNRFAASFLGGCNVFPGTWQSAGIIKAPFGLIKVSSAPPSEIRCWGIRRENVQFANAPGENTFAAQIENITYTGAQTEYSASVNGHTVRISQSNNIATNGARVGEMVWAYFPPESILSLEGD